MIDPESRRERLSNDELVARLIDTSESRNELRVRQIAPACEQWQYGAALRIRAKKEDAALDVYYDQSSWVQTLLTHREERRAFDLHQAADRTYVGYGNLLRALIALAPFLEDVRFVLSDWSEDWVDEYEIVGGELRVSRGFLDEEDDDLAYWRRRIVRSPDDVTLRRFVVQSHVDEVQGPLRQLDRLTGQERANAIANLGELLDHAASLDDRDAELWRARGRLARAAGALDEADQAFAHAAELAPEHAAALRLDQALVAFTAGDDDRARAHLEAALAGGLEHSGARLLAAHLAAEDPLAGEAAAHTAALLALIEVRRRKITPLEEAQRGLVWIVMEPAEEDLIRTGRHVALLERFRARCATCAPELRTAAVAYLLGWAEIFRIRAAHDRGKDEATALAHQLYLAAAALEPSGPLAGSVAYYHALLFGKKSEAGVARLEAGLLVAPDHLCTLGELGAAARKAGDLPRAIELLERYVSGFRHQCKGGSPLGLSFDFHRAELWSAYYQRACFALYGVPPGAPRPPGRPTDLTLAAAEAALAPALALAEELPQDKRASARAAARQCMASSPSTAAMPPPPSSGSSGR